MEDRRLTDTTQSLRDEPITLGAVSRKMTECGIELRDLRARRAAVQERRERLALEMVELDGCIQATVQVIHGLERMERRMQLEQADGCDVA